MLSAFLSALASASGLIVDKITLSRRHVALELFLPALFTVLFLITLTLLPTFGYVDWHTALLSNNLFLTVLLVFIAIASNVLLYQNLRIEPVHKHEVVMMLGPIVTIVLAAVFFQEEFSLSIFGLAVIASLALVFARAERHHFKFSKSSYNMFLAVVLISLEAMIVRELLFTFAPVSLYALRTATVAGFFYLYYQPKRRELAKVPWSLILASGVIGVIQMVGKYYAFDELGIIFTTLVLTLSPIIVFIASWEILHERIRPRLIISSIIIIACVVSATVIKSGG